MYQLFGQSLEPATLHGRPRLHGIDFLHGMVHPLLEREQRFTDGGLADIADDAGGYFLVGLGAPGAFQAGLAEAILVEEQAHFTKLLTRQIFRAVNHDAKGCRLVKLFVDKLMKAFKVVRRFLVFAVVLLANHQLVGVCGNYRVIFRPE